MKKDEIIITNYSLEAERAVLGSVLIYKNSIEDVFSKILDVNYFYVPTHQLIFSLMKELKANDRLIDVISLTDLAKVKGNIDDIGYMYIVDLMDNAPPSTELVSNSLEIILDKFRRRTLLSDLSTLKDNIETTTGLSKFTDLVNEHQGNLFDLLNLNHTKGARHIETAVIDLSLKYEELKKGNMKVIENQFTKSGFSNLDDMITGLKNGSLVILAARPAQGKSAMMLNIATNIAKTGLPVVIFSLEMLANELTERIITAEAEINTYQINNGIADWDKLKTSTEKVKQLPIFIQDTTLKNVSEIYSQVLKIKNKYKRIGAVFLDYIQLIDTGEDDATQSLTKISRALKLMAMDLDVPVVALSQLSRAVEQRANKRPILSDLRQSGSLEQDADQVFFLYRDEYYNPDTDKKRIAEFIIAKFRDGAVGTVEMYFDPFITKFTDLEKV